MAPNDSATAEPAADVPSVLALVRAMQAELLTAVHDRLHLVTLECRQASLSAMQMVLLSTLAALMLCGAWATLLVAFYMAFTHHGMPWALALLLILLLNLLGAILVWLRAHSLSAAFTFPATRRMLKGYETSRPDPEHQGERQGLAPSAATHTGA